MLETITQPMAELEHGNTTQHMRDMEAYQAYKRNDRVAHILMQSSMRYDLMLCFEKYRSNASSLGHCQGSIWWDLNHEVVTIDTQV